MRTSATCRGRRSISRPMSRERGRRSCRGSRRWRMLDSASRERGAAEPPRSPGAVLTSDQMAAYRKQGWLLARGFIAPAGVDALARWTDELAARPEEPGKHMVYRVPSRIDGHWRVIQRIESMCP